MKSPICAKSVNRTLVKYFTRYFAIVVVTTIVVTKWTSMMNQSYFSVFYHRNNSWSLLLECLKCISESYHGLCWWSAINSLEIQMIKLRRPCCFNMTVMTSGVLAVDYQTVILQGCWEMHSVYTKNSRFARWNSPCGKTPLKLLLVLLSFKSLERCTSSDVVRRKSAAKRSGGEILQWQRCVTVLQLVLKQHWEIT